MNEMFRFCRAYNVPLSSPLESSFQNYSLIPFGERPARIRAQQCLIARMELSDIDALSITLQVDVIENERTPGLFKLPKNFTILRFYTLDDRLGVMGLNNSN